MIDLPPRLTKAIDELDEAGRRGLLNIITMPRRDRARLIGRLHQDQETRSLAELLIDLEADPRAKSLVIETIRTDP